MMAQRLPGVSDKGILKIWNVDGLCVGAGSSAMAGLDDEYGMLAFETNLESVLEHK